MLKTRTFRALALALAVITLIPAVTMASWPVANRSSYMSQRFHDGHRGIDIVAPNYTGIVAIGSGKTVYAGYRNNCGGYQVWVSHGNGLYSAYYHMASERSHAGEYVTGSSEVIGYLGATGCASGNHLHVEVWKGFPWRSGSYRVNPWSYIDGGNWYPYRYR